MEYKDPVFELLSSLEHIVFKDDNQKLTSNRKSTVFSEFEQLRKGTGLKIDDFANVMGVSVAMVREWESRRVRPSPTELKLMRLIQANPQLSRQLLDKSRAQRQRPVRELLPLHRKKSLLSGAERALMLAGLMYRPQSSRIEQSF